ALSELSRARLFRVPGGAKVHDPEVTGLAGGRLVRVEAIKVAPHHQPDDAVVVDLLTAEHAGVAAVAQHDYPISEIADFAETMGNVYDAHSLGSQVSCYFHQARGLRQSQAGRRLIHYQYSRVEP